MDKKERFYKIYANLPLPIRDEIIAVVSLDGQKEPITWKVAKLEIDENTKTGQQILEELDKLKII